MQKTAILWLLFVLYFTANAQQIVVRNPNTNKPIEGVSITGIPNRVWTFTDHSGRADISRFNTTSAIEITALGFAPLRTTYGQLALSSEVYLKPTSIEINEYVVRAADNSQRVYTSKMDRLGAPAFTFYMPSNAADLLGISGSVFVQKSQQGGGSPMMRGFSANRLLYVVDGVRMNNAIFRSGNLHNVISLDPFATAFVEVLPGPHAVMYGSDALGGVMRFESLLLLPPDSGFETTGNASFRYASANREGSVNGQVIGNGRHFGFATSLSRYEYGDLRMGSSGPSEFLNTTYVKPTDYGDIEVANSDPRMQTGTGYSQLNLFQKFRFSPHPKLDVFLTAQWAQTSEILRYDRHRRRQNNQPVYGEWYYGPMIWNMHHLKIENRKANRFYDKATVGVAHQYFEEQRITRSYNSTDRLTQQERLHSFSLNADVIKELSSKHTLHYGLESALNTVFSEAHLKGVLSGSTAPAAPRYPKSETMLSALYTSLTWRPQPNITIQGGIRLTHYSLRAVFDTTLFALPFDAAFINTAAPAIQLGTVYNFSRKWNLRANIGSGFRTPNVDDVGKIFDSEPGALTIPNPTLRSEYAYSTDLTLYFNTTDLLTIEGGGFYTYLDGAMVRRNTTFNGLDSMIYEGEMSAVQSIQNAALAHLYGIEGQMEWRNTKGLHVKARVAWQTGTEVDDKGQRGMARHAPPFFGKTVIGYTRPRWRTEFYVLYSGERKFEDMPISERNKLEIYAIDAAGRPWSPGWYTLNIKSAITISENILLSLGIENLLDVRYRPYSSGIAAAGRNLTVSVKGSF